MTLTACTLHESQNTKMKTVIEEDDDVEDTAAVKQIIVLNMAIVLV